jgi:hypothetical protein
MSECSICSETENLLFCECGLGPYCSIHLSFHKNNTCPDRKKNKAIKVAEEKELLKKKAAPSKIKDSEKLNEPEVISDVEITPM